MITTVILNGPPGSGKDAIGALLHRELPNSRLLAYKDKLYELTAKQFKLELEIFKQLATDRDSKEEPLLALHGKSPRQALIYTSEEIVKPKLGKSYFGKALAASLHDGVNIVTDGGFPDEVHPVADRSDMTIIVRLSREGCSFEGDSRNYIHLKRPDLISFDLGNNGTLGEAFNEVNSFISMFQ